MNWICDNFIVQFTVGFVSNVTTEISTPEIMQYFTYVPDVALGHVFCKLEQFLTCFERGNIFHLIFSPFYVCKVYCWWKVLLHNFFRSREKRSKKRNSWRPLHNNFAWWYFGFTFISCKEEGRLLYTYHSFFYAVVWL